MSKKFIAGSGLSGLIYAYYHPEFKIISPEIGGKLSNSFMKNIIYLHADEASENFLKDLNIEIKKKTQIIKYVKGGECRNEVTIIDKICLIKKKMGDEKFEVIDTNLSTNDYYISIFLVDFDEIINKLKEKCDIIKDKIIRITETEIITEKSRYEYDNIISTLPADIFWDLYYQKQEFELKSKSITFVLCDNQPFVTEHSTYDLCYFIDKKYKYTRVSKKDDLFLYEFSGDISKEEVKQYLPKDCKIREYFVEKNGIIFTDEKNIPPKNIQFLGRFALWNHSYKINNVIEFSQWSYDFREIWNRQKSFSSKVLDLDKLKNIDEKEEQTKIFILHLLGELGELLGELNYKQHKKKTVVNIDKIKEELIDNFKYLLNIFLVWDVDVKEFIKLFNDKSKIVEERFEKQ